jgi:hypothetical protein
MIRWEICKQDFEWDGSWRDIYIFKTTLHDWQTLSDFLRTTYELKYSIDGEQQAFPKLVNKAFAVRANASALLNFQAHKILFACHFFSPEEIEFDIDPREIKSQSDINVLLNFMQRIGNVLCKPVVLTPESGREFPIISYEPASQKFQHHKVSA